MRLALLIPLAVLALCAATVAASRSRAPSTTPAAPSGHHAGGPRVHYDDVPLVHDAVVRVRPVEVPR